MGKPLPPPRPPLLAPGSGLNATALASTIAALDLQEEHAAIVAHAITLANAIDAAPDEAKLHAEYRQVLRALIEAGQPEGEDAFARLLAQLRS